MGRLATLLRNERATNFRTLSDALSGEASDDDYAVLLFQAGYNPSGFADRAATIAAGKSFVENIRETFEHTMKNEGMLPMDMVQGRPNLSYSALAKLQRFAVERSTDIGDRMRSKIKFTQLVRFANAVLEDLTLYESKRTIRKVVKPAGVWAPKLVPGVSDTGARILVPDEALERLDKAYNTLDLHRRLAVAFQVAANATVDLVSTTGIPGLSKYGENGVVRVFSSFGEGWMSAYADKIHHPYGLPTSLTYNKLVDHSSISRENLKAPFVNPETGEALTYDDGSNKRNFTPWTRFEYGQVPNRSAQSGDVAVVVRKKTVAVPVVSGSSNNKLTVNLVPRPKITKQVVPRVVITRTVRDVPGQEVATGLEVISDDEDDQEPQREVVTVETESEIDRWVLEKPGLVLTTQALKYDPPEYPDNCYQTKVTAPSQDFIDALAKVQPTPENVLSFNRQYVEFTSLLNRNYYGHILPAGQLVRFTDVQKGHATSKALRLYFGTTNKPFSWSTHTVEIMKRGEKIDRSNPLRLLTLSNEEFIKRTATMLTTVPESDEPGVLQNLTLLAYDAMRSGQVTVAPDLRPVDLFSFVRFLNASQVEWKAPAMRSECGPPFFKKTLGEAIYGVNQLSAIVLRIVDTWYHHEDRGTFKLSSGSEVKVGELRDFTVPLPPDELKRERLDKDDDENQIKNTERLVKFIVSLLPCLNDTYGKPKGEVYAYGKESRAGMKRENGTLFGDEIVLADPSKPVPSPDDSVAVREAAFGAANAGKVRTIQVPSGGMHKVAQLMYSVFNGYKTSPMIAAETPDPSLHLDYLFNNAIISLDNYSPAGGQVDLLMRWLTSAAPFVTKLSLLDNGKQWPTNPLGIDLEGSRQTRVETAEGTKVVPQKQIRVHAVYSDNSYLSCLTWTRNGTLKMKMGIMSFCPSVLDPEPLSVRTYNLLQSSNPGFSLRVQGRGLPLLALRDGSPWPDDEPFYIPNGLAVCFSKDVAKAEGAINERDATCAAQACANAMGMEESPMKYYFTAAGGMSVGGRVMMFNGQIKVDYLKTGSPPTYFNNGISDTPATFLYDEYVNFRFKDLGPEEEWNDAFIEAYFERVEASGPARYRPKPGVPELYGAHCNTPHGPSIQMDPYYIEYGVPPSGNVVNNDARNYGDPKLLERISQQLGVIIKDERATVFVPGVVPIQSVDQGVVDFDMLGSAITSLPGSFTPWGREPVMVPVLQRERLQRLLLFDKGIDSVVGRPHDGKDRAVLEHALKVLSKAVAGFLNGAWSYPDELMPACQNMVDSQLGIVRSKIDVSNSLTTVSNVSKVWSNEVAFTSSVEMLKALGVEPSSDDDPSDEPKYSNTQLSEAMDFRVFVETLRDVFDGEQPQALAVVSLATKLDYKLTDLFLRRVFGYFQTMYEPQLEEGEMGLIPTPINLGPIRSKPANWSGNTLPVPGLDTPSFEVGGVVPYERAIDEIDELIGVNLGMDRTSLTLPALLANDPTMVGLLQAFFDRIKALNTGKEKGERYQLDLTLVPAGSDVKVLQGDVTPGEHDIGEAGGKWRWVESKERGFMRDFFKFLNRILGRHFVAFNEDTRSRFETRFLSVANKLLNKYPEAHPDIDRLVELVEERRRLAKEREARRHAANLANAERIARARRYEKLKKKVQKLETGSDRMLEPDSKIRFMDQSLEDLASGPETSEIILKDRVVTVDDELYAENKQSAINDAIVRGAELFWRDGGVGSFIIREFAKSDSGREPKWTGYIVPRYIPKAARDRLLPADSLVKDVMKVPVEVKFRLGPHEVGGELVSPLDYADLWENNSALDKLGSRLDVGSFHSLLSASTMSSLEFSRTKEDIRKWQQTLDGRDWTYMSDLIRGDVKTCYNSLPLEMRRSVSELIASTRGEQTAMMLTRFRTLSRINVGMTATSLAQATVPDCVVMHEGITYLNVPLLMQDVDGQWHFQLLLRRNTKSWYPIVSEDVTEEVKEGRRKGTEASEFKVSQRWLSAGVPDNLDRLYQMQVNKEFSSGGSTADDRNPMNLKRLGGMMPYLTSRTSNTMEEFNDQYFKLDTPQLRTMGITSTRSHNEFASLLARKITATKGQGGGAKKLGMYLGWEYLLPDSLMTMSLMQSLIRDKKGHRIAPSQMMLSLALVSAEPKFQDTEEEVAAAALPAKKLVRKHELPSDDAGAGTWLSSRLREGMPEMLVQVSDLVKDQYLQSKVGTPEVTIDSPCILMDGRTLLRIRPELERKVKVGHQSGQSAQVSIGSTVAPPSLLVYGM